MPAYEQSEGIPDCYLRLFCMTVSVVFILRHTESKGRTFSRNPKGNVPCNILKAVIHKEIRLQNRYNLIIVNNYQLKVSAMNMVVGQIDLKIRRGDVVVIQDLIHARKFLSRKFHRITREKPPGNTGTANGTDTSIDDILISDGLQREIFRTVGIFNMVRASKQNSHADHNNKYQRPYHGQYLLCFIIQLHCVPPGKIFTEVTSSKSTIPAYVSILTRGRQVVNRKSGSSVGSCVVMYTKSPSHCTIHP